MRRGLITRQITRPEALQTRVRRQQRQVFLGRWAASHEYGAWIGGAAGGASDDEGEGRGCPGCGIIGDRAQRVEEGCLERHETCFYTDVMLRSDISCSDDLRSWKTGRISGVYELIKHQKVINVPRPSSTGFQRSATVLLHHRANTILNTSLPRRRINQHGLPPSPDIYPSLELIPPAHLSNPRIHTPPPFAHPNPTASPLT